MVGRGGALVGFGGSTAVEGFTQAIGLGEGETGYNFGAMLAAKLGREIATQIYGNKSGDAGERVGKITYHLVDLAISLKGATVAGKSALGVETFEQRAWFRVIQEEKVSVFIAQGNDIRQVVVKAK